MSSESCNNNIVDFSNIGDKDIYINNDIDLGVSSPELNVSNLSWASIVEEELGDSLNDKKLTGLQDSMSKSNKEEKTDKKNINMDDIPKFNVQVLSDLEILEYETMLSGHLRKYMKNFIEEYEACVIHNPPIFDIISVIEKLEWLKYASKYLSDKIGLTILPHNKFNQSKNSFPRSSYKFCNYNYECEFNYNIKKYKGCFAQHYVHNTVYSDIESLISCIKTLDVNKNEIDNYKEIKKSINTISFVFNHMFEELKNISIYVKKGDLIHIERTPDKKRKDRKRRKKNNKLYPI